MPNLGFQEILVILVIALIVFGPKKLPEIGRSLGQGLREFKKVSNELVESISSTSHEEPEQPKQIEAAASKPAEDAAVKPKEEVASKEGEA